MQPHNKHTSHEQHAAQGHPMKHQKPYGRLALMAVLSFISMYVLMYAMVNTFANVLPNVNQVYMAGLMTMPMILIELVVMGAMYMNRRTNAMVVAGLALFFWFIRQQTLVTDRQFLKSMIPHHSAAILMCQEADITDPELKKLCDEIVTGQQREIEQMEAKLKELDK